MAMSDTGNSSSSLKRTYADGEGSSEGGSGGGGKRDKNKKSRSPQKQAIRDLLFFQLHRRNNEDE